MKTRNKFKRVLVMCMVALMALVSAVPTMNVEAKSKTIKVQPLSSGVYNYECYGRRSGNNATVKARCKRVYPLDDGMEDTFTKIRATAFKKTESGKMVQISKGTLYVLEETKSAVSMRIRDGELKVKYVYFGFIGNSNNYGAHALVGYDTN